MYIVTIEMVMATDSIITETLIKLLKLKHCYVYGLACIAAVL